MRVRVDEIPDDGVDVSIGQEDAWAVAAASRATEGEVTDLIVEVQLTRIAELLRVSGTASAQVARPCDRCGKVIFLRLVGTIELLFEPLHADSLPEEHITDPSELNMGFFDGRSLELEDVVMEQFALWLPDVVRCGDASVTQPGQPWTCAVAPQDPGPDLDRHNPFANLRLPE